MYTTTLVGTDGSDTATLAVKRAAEMAAGFASTLVIVSAFHPIPASEVDAERREAPEDVAWSLHPRAHVEAVLSAAEAVATEAGATSVQTVAVEGSAREVLLDAAERFQASVIVVGSVGLTGAKRLFLGSVPSRVVHHADIDVVVVRTDRAA